MIIDEIYINNFGCLSNKKIKFKSGLNMIYGNNESGKSTIFAFVKFILYGVKVHKSNNLLNFKKKFMPWSGQPMSGTMKVITENGCKYEISRMVSETKNIIEIVDLSTGKNVTNNEFLKSPGKYLLSLGEDAFSNVSFLADLSSKSTVDKDGDIIIALSNDESYENSYMKIKERLNNKIADISSTRRKNAILPSLYNQRNELLQRNSEKYGLISQKESINEELQALQKCIGQNNHFLEDLTKSNLCNNKAYNELGKIMSNPLSKYFGITPDEIHSAKLSHSNIAAYLILFALFCLLGAYLYINHINIILLWLTFSTAFSILGICIYKIIKKYSILDRYSVTDDKEFMQEYNLYLELARKKEEIETCIINQSNEKYVNSKQNDILYFTFENNNDKIDTLKDEISQLNVRKAVLEEKLSNIDALIERYNDTDYTLKNIESQIDENSKLLSAYELALDVLEKSFNEVKNNFSPKLSNFANTYFESITGKSNVELIFDDTFAIKFKTKYGYTNSEFLSRGTYEQLYTAFRFALCDCISNGVKLPMFLDDAFNNYDDNRLLNVLKFIKVQSNKRQIFITSCRANEFLFFRNEDINIIDFNSERNDFNG